MKIRNGFVSNSSSSSFIVCGFSTNDSCKVYDMLKERFEEEDPCISEEDVYWKAHVYLTERGLDYLYQWDYFRQGEWKATEEIGCILEEGSKERFDESLKKAEDTLKKFDEEHRTDFAKGRKIYSVFEKDF